MKVSLKFGEEKSSKPIIRAKIPVSILNIPFLTAIAAGDTPDISFSLRSDLSFGPAISLSYHPALPPPNAAFPPFSLSIKSGIGPFGSPKDSPLVFEANFSPNCVNSPVFSLFVKPRFGNFSLFKAVGSCGGVGLGNGSVPDFVNGGRLGDGSDLGGFSMVNLGGGGTGRVDGHGLNDGLGKGSVSDFGKEGNLANGSNLGSFSVFNLGGGGGRVDWHGLNGGLSNGSVSELGKEGDLGNGLENGGVLKGLRKETTKGGLLSGIFVAARTSMPIAKRAVVNFRWGVDFPSRNGGSKTRFPVLVMNKISLERVEEGEKVVEKRKDEELKSKAGDLELLKGMCGWMMREVEDLQKENREMRNALEGLRSKPGFASKNRGEERGKVGKKAVHSPSPSGEGMSEFDKWRSNKSGGCNVGGEEYESREGKKSASEVSELESELQKAIKAAS